MAVTIITKNSTVAATAPSAGQLVQGELAVNVTDKKLYTLDGSGNVVLLATGSAYDVPVVISVNSSSAALRITQTGAGNALLVEDSANPDATPFVIDASGNVGIGTTSPTQKLSVSDAAGAGAGSIAIGLTDTTSSKNIQLFRTGTTYSYAGIGGGEGALYNLNSNLNIVVDGAAAIKLNTNGSERMRITSAGGVSFGATGTAYGTSGQALISAGNAPPVYTTQFVSAGYVIDGGGVPITSGIKGDITIPFGCTIIEWTLLADQSGSIVVDIWKDTYANYPPTVADTITGSALPTITTATKGQSSTLTGWTSTITAGDTLRFNVNSATTITRVTLSLKLART